MSGLLSMILRKLSSRLSQLINHQGIKTPHRMSKLNSTQFPDHLQYLLSESKFLHLATSNPDTNVPSISMMHYLYIAEEQTFLAEDSKLIVFLTPRHTTKFKNISLNKHVSVLLHDWMLSGKENPNEENENFSNLLKQLNQQELKRNISASITGEAFVLKDEKEIQYYQDVLQKEDPESMNYKCDSYAIIKIKITSVKTSDEKNNINVIE